MELQGQFELGLAKADQYWAKQSSNVRPPVTAKLSTRS